jgi:DNA excision repair protein ERCC-4
VAPLLFDHRDAKSGLPAALAVAAVNVAPAQLPADDYIVSDRLVVERKALADDLGASSALGP